MTHTKGPWKAIAYEGKWRIESLAPKIRKCVAYIYGNRGTAHAEADAHLIAAAPELLEALKGMIDMYKELVDSGDAGFWDAEQVKEVIAGRAAIAKAEGRA